MYIGCGTAETYKVGTHIYDLLSSTYNKGAHFVLGTTDEVKTSTATTWTINFSTAATYQNTTIADCMSYASWFIGNIELETVGDLNCLLHK